MRYSRRISNYAEIITLSYPTHMVIIVDLVTIDLETLRIDGACYLKKEFTKLICMNP